MTDAAELPDSAGDVVVVGGGIGGLVVARSLAQAGRKVTLLEASDHLGGGVARLTVGGIEVDAGAESFATRGGIVAALATELGLADAIVAPNPAGAWLQPARGAAVALPQMSLLGIPGSPLASDVAAVIGWGPAWRAFLLDTVLPGFVGAKSRTLGELVRRRMGERVLTSLVVPIVRGVHTADPMDLEIERVAPGLIASLRHGGSLARAVRQLRSASAIANAGSQNAAGNQDATAAGSAVAGIRGGLSRIVEELEADLERFGVEIRMGVRATAVATGEVLAGDDRYAGQVVVAAPGLVGAPPETGRVVLAILVIDDARLDAAPRGTGVLVADGAPGIRAKALTHSTAKWQWLAERAAGRHVVRLSYTPDAAAAAGDAFAELALADASALFGIDIAPSSVLDFARVEWTRPGITVTAEHPAPQGIAVVGETAAGTGLANIVAHAGTVAQSLREASSPT